MKRSPLFPARLLAGVAALLLAACATMRPAASVPEPMELEPMAAEAVQESALQPDDTEETTVAAPTERRRGRTHGVVRGDTLWAISDSYLTDPFMWPKVWDYNGQIMNPDLIYPGDIVRIPTAMLPPEIRELIDTPEIEVGAVGTVETEEGEVRISDTSSGVGSVDAEEAALAGEFQSQSTEELELGARPEQRGLPEPVKAVEVRSRQGGVNPMLVEGAGFIMRKYRPLGVLLGMNEPRQLLGTGDDVFLKLKKRKAATPGTVLTIVRVDHVVVHPVTEEALGKLVVVLGVARVVGITREGLTHARIERAYDIIQPGDEIIPYVPPVVGLERKAPEGLVGVVLESKDGATLLGVGHIVYLDLGEKDGVKPGNEFTAVRRGRSVDVPGMWASPRLPSRDSAVLRVLSVQEQTSTAILMRQQADLNVGDPVFSGDTGNYAPPR